jgi:predicted AAA+ superfamily ATPase
VARWVDRPSLLGAVRQALKHYPVVLLVGPRQCGKTSLAREVAGVRGVHFDLEDPESALHADTAKQVLAPLKGLVVIDEFQRQPRLFELIRVLADRRPLPARFLILGSASPDLMRGSSETLAGRVAYHEMSGFDLTEVERSAQTALWTRGGFPRALLARTDHESYVWRVNFVRSFLERDIPQLGIRVPASALRRFWTMLAHYHGQLWNAAELARALGTGENAVRHYLDILTGAFMVRQLPPWFENVGKRLVKSPRIYLRDTGILHALLGIRNRLEAHSHPKLGASWEGFALEQVIRLADADREAFFYRTQAGAELDLVIARGRKRFGFEFKYADSPRPTKSMHIALDDLRLDRLFVVYPGARAHALHRRIVTVPLQDLARTVQEFG